MQNRFKSKVLWVAIFALIALIAKNFFNYDIPNYNVLVDTILTILVSLGVVNNPVNGDGI